MRRRCQQLSDLDRSLNLKHLKTRRSDPLSSDIKVASTSPSRSECAKTRVHFHAEVDVLRWLERVRLALKALTEIDDRNWAGVPKESSPQIMRFRHALRLLITGSISIIRMCLLFIADML